MLPPGRYLSYVTASDGSVVVAQSVAFEADAFVVKPSDATPGRGQTITVNVTSAEPLSASPRLSVYEPGLAGWSVDAQAGLGDRPTGPRSGSGPAVAPGRSRSR